jgi:uncharacterized protein
LNVQNQINSLHQAIHTNNVEKVIFLIKSGAFIERIDINHVTALNLAIQLDRLEIFKLLLNAGANINASTLSNITQFDGTSNIEMLSLVLDVGIDVNIKLEDGETLLMYAARQGTLEIVKQLVELGADINYISRQADFALLEAACQANQDIFDYLAPKTCLSLRQLAAERLPTRFAKQLKVL